MSTQNVDAESDEDRADDDLRSEGCGSMESRSAGNVGTLHAEQSSDPVRDGVDRACGPLTVHVTSTSGQMSDRLASHRDIDSASHEQVANEWSSGNGLSARQAPAKSKTGGLAFDSAGYVAVTIDLAQLPLTVVLDWPFTQQYCSVAVHPQPDADGECRVGTCVLAFELPSVSKEAATYALLQAGLETRYRGARQSSGTLQVYRSTDARTTQILGHRLTPEAVQGLKQLGKEDKTIRRDPDAGLRSSFRLDLDAVIKTRQGTDQKLGTLYPSDFSGEQAEPEVYCPVHADTQPSAYVFRTQDDMPLLACTHCHRGFTVRNANNDYDFAQFERTFRTLAKAESEPQMSLGGTEAESEVQTSPDDVVDAAPQFELRDERYLGGLSIEPGILCVKSPKGTGKTEALVELIKHCRQAKQHVLLIGHRRTLLLAMAQRLGLWCYIVPPEVRERAPRDKGERLSQLRTGLLPTAQAREAFRKKFFYATPAKSKGKKEPNDRHKTEATDQLPESEPAVNNPDADSDDVFNEGLDKFFASQDFKFGEPRHYYAVSLDSLTVLNPKHHRYEVVIIDEAEQVFGHLVGATLKNNKRREVFKLLEHYLRVAKTVILLDADLGMVTMTSLFAMRLVPDTSVRFILNEYKQRGGEVQVYPGKAQLVDRLHMALKAGEKCYLATNSKNKAIELHKSLAEVHPDARVATIHADNASTAEVQSLLGDIANRFERDLDLLIASPALGTGIDITFKDKQGNSRAVVDHVFGLFFGMINTHFDMDQQMMRVRHPGQVHLWVDQVEQNFETDIGVIKNELLRTSGETRTLVGYEDDGTPILAADDRLVEIWARVRAANRGSKNRLSDLLKELRIADGWRVGLVPEEDDQSRSGTAALKLGKELRVQERFDQIQAAQVIDSELAAKLEERDKKGLALTAEQRWGLERHRIEKFYAEPVSEKLIELDNDGRMRQAVLYLEILLAPDAVNEAVDKRQLGDGNLDESVWLADRASRCVKARLLREVLAAAGVYDLKKRELAGEVVLQQDMLAIFVSALRKNGKQFESVFELKPRKDASHQSMRQLSEVLGKVGLEMALAHVTDAGGKKVRWYRLDAERLTRMRTILTQREAARLAVQVTREAERAENEAAFARGSESPFVKRLEARLQGVSEVFRPS